MRLLYRWSAWIVVIFMLGIITVSVARSQEIETRTFCERSQGYDKNYYTDIGVDVRLKNKDSIFQIKRGVMFSSLNDWKRVGNHQFYYLGTNVSYKLPVITLHGEILTEINPIEGNDLGITSQRSIQGFGADVGILSIKRSKWTNGDFYADYGVNLLLEKWFTETKLNVDYVTIGLRGNSDLFTLSTDKACYLETGVSHWWKIPLMTDVAFNIRAQYFLRHYFENDVNNISGSLSVGLIGD